MQLERNTQIWVFRILKPNHEIFINYLEIQINKFNCNQKRKKYEW